MNYILGFVRVHCEVGVSYGGDQNWFRAKDRKKLADYGCGMVSACDILLHLAKHRKIVVKERFGFFHKVLGQTIIEKDDYLEYLYEMSRRFFPIFWLAKGTWGPVVAFGFNVFARSNGLPYRARWNVKAGNIKEKIAEMIGNDIPVLFAVGAPFPRLWKKDGVTLYVRNEYDKRLHRYGTTGKHYMTITGHFEEDGAEWLRVSSWGREFFIKWDEYADFVEKTSCPLLSNILYIYKDC